jgi:predicted DNA-binding transcriptional regulator YafY
MGFARITNANITSNVEQSVPGACNQNDNPPSTVPCPLSTDAIPHPSAPWLPLHVETRTAHPLHIYCLDNVWYLYLWDPMRKDIRRFTLSRMHSLRRTGETFKPRRFSVKKHIDHRLGVTSGDPVKVVVQFRGKASFLVAERPWFDSQELAPGPDSEWNLEHTMHVAHTPELERWILGFDQDALVTEPAAPRDSIANKLVNMVANYQAPA